MAKRGTKRRPGVLARALIATSRLREEVRAGLQGLESRDTDKVKPEPPDFVTDSLALDASAPASQKNKHRWDYLLGTRSRKKPIVGVEVHPVTAGEVVGMIKKKQWAVAEMDKHFQSGQHVSAWYWVASGSTRLSKTTREYRRLTQAGITLAGARITLSEGKD